MELRVSTYVLSIPTAVSLLPNDTSTYRANREPIFVFRANRRRSGNYYSKQSFPWEIRLNSVADYQCTEAAIRTACHCTGLRQSVVSSNLG